MRNFFEKVRALTGAAGGSLGQYDAHLDLVYRRAERVGEGLEERIHGGLSLVQTLVGEWG